MGKGKNNDISYDSVNKQKFSIFIRKQTKNSKKIHKICVDTWRDIMKIVTLHFTFCSFGQFSWHGDISNDAAASTAARGPLASNRHNFEP